MAPTSGFDYQCRICDSHETHAVLSHRWAHLRHLRLCHGMVDLCYSDYWKRWRDVIGQYPGHSHGYKSITADA